MNPLSPEQVVAVGQLKTLCDQWDAEMVLIGAMAYRTWIQDPYRHTLDIDVAVAVDLDDYRRLTEQLRRLGWEQEGRIEHRWTTPEGVRMDLIPGGPGLREKGILEWPVSKMRMSLIGFEHVFKDSVPYPLAPDLSVNIIPVPVLALLKIIAYEDSPYERQKDLQDFVAILKRYELEGDRRFRDEVFHAGFDYDEAGAYLLGMDLKSLCSDEETAQVLRFIDELNNRDTGLFHLFSRAVRSEFSDSDEPAEALAAAFASGFTSPPSSG